MSLTVLIPAAGAGRRMQAGINKQYLLLDGIPILTRTIQLFEDHPDVSQIWVVVPEAEISLCREQVLEPFRFSKVQDIVAGGAERQDSVRNGLRACDCGSDQVVLIHDGVRPLFDPMLIEPLVQGVRQVGACILGVPVKDTIKQVSSGRILGTPDRSSLWQAQTPQAFFGGVIRDAHERAHAEGFRGTDDASLVERLGQPVAIVPGNYRNLKITTPEDLAVASALLADRAERVT